MAKKTTLTYHQNLCYAPATKWNQFLEISILEYFDNADKDTRK